jgi:hypothetical protein
MARNCRGYQILEIGVEQEMELCILLGTSLPVDKIQQYVRGNFSSLNWEDLLLLASALCVSLTHTLGLFPDSIRTDETIELSERSVRPVIRLVTKGSFEISRSRIESIILSTICRLKSEILSQPDLINHESILAESAIEQIRRFMTQNGEKRLDGQVQFTLENGKVITVSGRLGSKPVDSIDEDETRTMTGVVESIAYTSRELKIRTSGCKAMTTCKFILPQLKTLCELLGVQQLAKFAIEPTLDAKGKKFDVLKELEPLEDRDPLDLVSRG